MREEEEKGLSDTEKIKLRRGAKEESEEIKRLRNKIDQANQERKGEDKEINKESLESEQEKEENDREDPNEELLKTFSQLSQALEKNQERYGNAFLEQKEDILKNLREFVDQKHGVDLNNPNEKKALDESLVKKLQEEIQKRFKLAA